MNNLASNEPELANDKTIQHSINPNTSYRVTSKSEIFSLLSKLEKNHSLLSIIVSGSSKMFGSMILEVNENKPYLVLDELYPRNEISESLLKKKLSIETQLEGIEIRFSVTVDAAAMRDEIEYYKVSYPTFVFHLQRRSSFRASVGLSESIPVALSTDNDRLLQAELRDISLDGISAQIKSPLARELSVGDEIPTCVIHTPEGKKILASLEIARIKEMANSQAIRIGARFIHISATDRHDLSRFIAQLDRQNIKKLKRSPADA